MVSVADLQVVISADTRDAEKGISGVEQRVGLLGKTASGITGAIGGVAKGLATFGLAAQGVKVLGGALSGLVSAASESQRVAAQTDAVIKSTGGAAGVTAQQVSDLASQLSKVAPIDDEVIQGAQNILLTFTNIGASVFPDVTKAAADMSVALGTDMNSAAMQLGKALNDPVAGMSKLTRAGVTFTEAQKEQVKAMVAAGDVAGAQGVILQELQKEFGGSAEAAGKTFGGQLAILKTQLGNVQETIGTALLPVLTTLASKALPYVQLGADKLADVLPKIVDAAGNLASRLKGPLQGAFVLIRDSVLTFVDALKGNWADDSGVRPLHRVVGNFGLLLRNTIIPAVTDFANFLTGTLWPLIKDGVGFVGDLVAAFQSGGLSGALSTLLSGITGLAGQVDWAGLATGIVSSLATALGTVTGIAWDAAATIAGWVTSVQWGTLATTILTGIRDAFLTVAGLTWDAATTVAGWLASVQWTSLATTILSGIVSAFTTVTGLVWDAATWLSGVLSGVDWGGTAATIWGGITAGFDAVTDAGARFAAWLQAQFQATDWSGIAQTIVGGISAAVDAAQDTGAGQGILDKLGLSPERVDSLMSGLKPLTDFLSGQFSAIMDNVKITLAGVGDAFKDLDTGEAGTALKNFATAIGVYIGAAITVFTLAVRGYTEVLSVVLPAAATIAVLAINNLAIVINTIAEVVKSVVKIITDIAHGDWSAAWDEYLRISQVVTDGIIQYLTNLDTVARELFGGMISAINEKMTQWATDAGLKAAALALAIVTGILTLPSDVSAKFTTLATDSVRILGELVSSATTKAVELYTGVYQWFRNLVTDALTKIAEIPTGMSTALSGLYTLGYDLLIEFKNGVSDALSEAYDAVAGWVAKIGQKLGEVDVPFFSPPGHAGYEIGSSYGQMMAKGIGDAVPLIEREITRIGRTLTIPAASVVSGNQYQGPGVSSLIFGNRNGANFGLSMPGNVTPAGAGGHYVAPHQWWQGGPGAGGSGGMGSGGLGNGVTPPPMSTNPNGPPVHYIGPSNVPAGLAPGVPGYISHPDANGSGLGSASNAPYVRIHPDDLRALSGGMMGSPI